MAIEIVPLTKADIPDSIECIQKAFADDPYFKWIYNDTANFNLKRNTASLRAHLLCGMRCDAPIFVAKETLIPETRDEKELISDNSISVSASEIAPSSSSTSSSTPGPSSRILGISIWIPPRPLPNGTTSCTFGTTKSWTTWFHEQVLSVHQLVNIIRFRGWGGLNVRRYKTWKARQAIAQARIWQDPRGYYFCNVVAVSDLARGKGVGRRLIEAVTSVADREGMPCYLESSKFVPNVAIYRKMGFELVGEIECEEGGEVCKLWSMIRLPKTQE